MRRARKTIREWEQEYGISLLDMDGLDTRDSKLFTRLMTREQFEQAAVQCTVMKTTVDKKVLSTKKKNRFVFFLIVATMPAIATLIIGWMYKSLARLFHIKWYVPAGILFADIIVFAIQPVTPIIAGPGYLWYQLLNFIYHLSMRGLATGEFLLLHRSLNLMGTTSPLLSTKTINGTAINLYFALAEAITSSIYWATLIVCAKDLLKKLTAEGGEESLRGRRKTRKSMEHNA